MKKRSTHLLVLLMTIAILFASCKKENKSELPSLSTLSATEITFNEAISGGNITSDGKAHITARGVIWDTTENPALEQHYGITNDGTGIGLYSSKLTGLLAETKYYVRAFATNSEGTAYGQQQTFTTTGTGSAPMVDFSGSPTNGTAILIVSFTDQSTNSPTSWIWDFGDGTTSTQQNYSKTYNSAGIYTVKLTATNSYGSNTNTKNNYIIVTSGGDGTWPPGTVHCSGTPTAIVDVINPATGKIWMDRNLGALQAATNSSDVSAYGDLYQWGRFADGHQCRNSDTTYTLSSIDAPHHNNFILVTNNPYDWRSPQNAGFWQGVDGVNNPCPTGYRLPTEAELNAERLSWSSNNHDGAFSSVLKLPRAGIRDARDGRVDYMGTFGYYWSANVFETKSRNLFFVNNDAFMNSTDRGHGFSVRCIKDIEAELGTINSLDCTNPTNSGILRQGVMASGVSSNVHYTGGNGGAHIGQIVSSTNVTGLRPPYQLVSLPMAMVH